MGELSVQLQSLKNRLAKIALFVGSAAVLFAIGGAGTVTYPSYTAFYYSAAIGLSLIVGGLLTLNVALDDQHDTHSRRTLTQRNTTREVGCTPEC